MVTLRQPAKCPIHKTAKRLDVVWLVNSRDCLLKDMETSAQVLELGLIGLFVFFAPRCCLVVLHLRNYGIQNRGQYGCVLSRNCTVLFLKFAQECQEIGQSWDNGRADFIVLVGKEP